MEDKKPDYADDEIDLRDLFKVLARRKITVAVTFILIVTASIFYSFILKPVYKAEAVVRIGRVEKALLSNQGAQRKLQNRETLGAIAQKLDKELTASGLRNSLKINTVKGTDLLELSFTANNPELAYNALEKIARKFIERNNIVFNSRINLIEEEVKTLTARKEAIEKEINSLRSKDLISSQFPLIQNALASYEKVLFDLSERVFDLKNQSSNAKGFAFFEAPSQPESPIKPKRLNTVIIAAVLGLILGAFLAFLKDFCCIRKEA